MGTSDPFLSSSWMHDRIFPLIIHGDTMHRFDENVSQSTPKKGKMCWCLSCLHVIASLQKAFTSAGHGSPTTRWFESNRREPFTICKARSLLRATSWPFNVARKISAKPPPSIASLLSISTPSTNIACGSIPISLEDRTRRCRS